MDFAGNPESIQDRSADYESRRLAALHQTGILDSPPQTEFDDLVALAAQICETPIASINLVDARRSWTKAAVGLSLRELPRALSFCTLAIQTSELLMIEDVRQDGRFAANPLVVNPPHVRFLCAAAIASADGFPIGTLCVLDRRPRSLSNAQIKGFQALRRQAMQLVNQGAIRAENVQTQQAHSLFSHILDAQSAMICHIGPEGRYTYANAAYERWFGASPGALIGRNMADVLGPAFSGVKPFIDSARNGEKVVLRSDFPHPDGSMRHFEAQLEQCNGVDGATGISAIITDITERNRAERALKESEERLRLAAHAANVGTWEFKSESGELIWDDHCRAMFGLPPGAPVTYEIFIGAVHPDDKLALESRIQATLERGGTYEKRYRAIGISDGVTRWIDSEGEAFRGPNNSVRLVGAKRDVTRSKRNADARQVLFDCARVTGPAFFDALTRALAAALQVRNAFMCEIHPAQPDTMRALSAWMDGVHVENVAYKHEGTPCAVAVSTGRPCFYRRDVARAFPDDVALIEMDAFAYLGVPLLGSDGTPLGVLSVIHDKAIDESLDPESLLEFLAGRAAAELERQRAELSVRESETQMRLVTDSVPALVSFIDTDLRFRFVNAAYQNWFGIGSHEIVGRTIREIVGDAAYEIIGPNAERALQGETVRAELLIPYRHGGARQVLTQYTPRRDDSGNVIGFVGLVHDLTTLKRAEAARAENEQRLLMALETARMGAWVRDLGTGKIETNAQFRLDFGSTPEKELSLAECYAMVHEDDRERVQILVDRAIASGEPFEAEFRVIWPDGSVRWNVARGQAYRDDAGEPSHMVGVKLDITDRRETEDALRDYDRRLKAIFNQTFEFMAVLTPDGRIVDVNATAMRGRDFQRASILGSPIWDAPWWSGMEDAQNAWRAAVREAVDTNTTVSFDGHYIAADGSLRQSSYATTPIRDDSGQVLNVLVEGTDITERQQAEEQKSLLIAELSHRVKNTLATIQSIAEHAARRETPHADFLSLLRGRIGALAATHTLLAEGGWQGVDLQQLIESVVNSPADAHGGCCDQQGPAVALPPKTALALGLAFHELAANAALHGAWRGPGGQANVAWERNEDGSDLTIAWRESGVLPVKDAAHYGFGRMLIEQGLRYDLGAESSIEVTPTGLVCLIRLPSAAIRHLNDPMI